MVSYDKWEYENMELEAEAATCPECGNYGKFVRENYGADADGNRGMIITYYECEECDHTW